jgi:formate dehydrogenase alpha subunit
MTNSIPEFGTDTNCFFIIGSNTTEAHPILSMHVLKGKKRGAKVIVIDPRKTQVGQWADIYYAHRPGTDVALINGLMNIIISEGLHDEAFIKERTEDFEALKSLVAEYTPEKVSQICDIPVDGLYEIARTYATIKPAAILYTLGITEHVTGLDNVKSTANLAMLCGNMGMAGSGVNPLRGQNNVQGACDMGALPNVYSGYQAVTIPEVQKKFQDAWGSTGPQTIGLTSTQMLPAAGEGKIRGLFIFGENPMVADPNTNHVRHCLEHTEFLVVQDIFPTETAQLAHVVLASASFAETDGTYTNTDRRVQRIRKAIEPIGESKENWLIICELARKMGAKGFDFSTANAIMDEISQLTPSYGGINYDRLETVGGLQWPCPTTDHPGTPFLHKGKFARGLGKFFALEFKEADELPDEEYPLVLTTGRIMWQYHTGSMTRRSKKLESEAPEAYVEIHPDDAKKIGLNGHKRVRVSSRRGQIELGVRITNDIRCGLVYIPFHWAEAAANVLTNDACDPITKTPEYKVCAVKVEVA